MVIDSRRFIRFLVVLVVFLAPLVLGAESDGSGNRLVAGREEAWLVEADRVMKELVAVDADLHSLTRRVENPESRNTLIRTRNELRYLIHELKERRNEVVNQLARRADGEYALVEAFPK